jgi:DNA-directed RNA polymerase sigma subunit (sigma70/sigma32)
MNNEPMTLREIAKEMGMSHQSVSEILDKAYRKIRKALKAKGLKLEDFV